MTPESCAKEIVESLCEHEADEYTRKSHLQTAESIIQRLLSSEVAAVHAEYQKRAKEWLRDIAKVEHIQPQLVSTPDAVKRCAAEVEALAPNKESKP